jgi:excisionase family DNA binding protein
LNLRPLGPEAPCVAVDGVAPGTIASHPQETTGAIGWVEVQPAALVGRPTTLHGAPVVRNSAGLDGDTDRLLTVREVAARLAVCSATVYALCKRGELPHARIASAIRIHPVDLETFVAEERQRGEGDDAE